MLACRRLAGLGSSAWAVLILILLLAHTGAWGQRAVHYETGPRGDLRNVSFHGTRYFQEVTLTFPAPGWQGTVADQSAAEPAGVRISREPNVTRCEYRLAAGAAALRVRQTVRTDGARLTLCYDVTPTAHLPVQHVLVRMLMPVEDHAGRTRYRYAGGATPGLTTLPAAHKKDAHILVPAGYAPSILLVGPSGSGVQVSARNASLQLQDDRQWNVPAFELFAAGPGGRLEADKTVTVEVVMEAMSAGEIQSSLRRLAAEDMALLPMEDNRPLKLGSVRLDRTRVPKYEPVELIAEVAARYDNPFDPDQIAVDAEVSGPSGFRRTVPGFYHVPAALRKEGAAERVVATGKPDFRVRFAPWIPGEYSIVLKVRNGGATVESAPMTFVAEASPNPGFVRVSERNPHYFARDDGSSFIAVGENVCWAGGPSPIARYREWFEGLGKAGGNWARLWLAYNEKGLEWSALPTERPGTGAYRGLGRYAMDNAWRLDEIVRIGRENGVFLMFCIGTYGEFTEGGFFNEGMWVSNPYNAANGGPCATPAEFWTNPTARKLYKQRLRYLIARYAHAVNLFAWEFWNEVPPTPDQEKWVAEMAAYIKQTDPYGHLVSTTYGSPAVWRCPDIDFTMTHMYGTADSTPDFTANIVAHTRDHRVYGKPYLLAEFGIDWQAPDTKWDPKGNGINMHNGAWAAIMAGGAGTAMIWWWDSYVHPNNLYRLLSPVAEFAKAVDWQAERLEPVSGIIVETAPDAKETFTDLVVSGDVDWGLTPSNEFTVRQDGTVQGRPVPMAIGSPTRSTVKELHSEVRWHLDLPRPTTVTLKLGQVCTRARMVVKVDDEVRVDRVLTSGEPGAGPWKTSRRLEQYNLWVSDYDEDIPLEIPAGKHTITIANTEGDWFQIRSMTLPGYQSSRFPAVNALGLSGQNTVVLWLHNRESTWKTAFQGRKPTPLEGLRVTVPVPRDGSWEVEWWDTWTGKVVRRQTVEASSGTVQLLPDVLATDWAAILRHSAP